MNINTVYPSKFLKADDLQGDTVVTISRVELETVGQGQDAETKPVLYFYEMEKGVVCNKTNASTVAGMYGPETDAWPNQRITLYPAEVQYGKEMVLAIRIRIRKPAPGQQTQAPSRIVTTYAQQPPAQRPAQVNPGQAPAPLAGIVNGAKKSAWEAIHAANPGADENAILIPWRAVIANVAGATGKDVKMFGAAEWNSVKAEIEAETGAAPMEDDGSEVPF